MLLAFDVFRFGDDFPKTYNFIKGWPIAPKMAPDGIIEHICKAINYACVLYPKRVLCLQRSFVTTCLARMCGVAAQMVIGAQKFPFKAHAWVETNGVVVNEKTNVQEIYGVWERC
jgi:hypothetical protein